MQIRSIVVAGALAACGGSRPGPSAGVGNASAGNPSERVLVAPAAPSSLAAGWIVKLGDPRESERAVTELEQLGDPGAIEALGQHWSENGRSVRVLQVMISLARPLTPEQARTNFVTDYEATGRPASWDRLLPFLRVALASIDIANPRSVDSATKAAAAIGEARLAAAMPELVELAVRPPDKKWITAQIEAVRAIGAIGGTDATKTLLGLIDREPPAHPRTATAATSHQDRRGLEERFSLHLAITGASINAVGSLSSPAEAEILIKQIYRTPELFMQLRRALVANGPHAVDALREILRGTHAGVNDFMRDRKLDRHCGDAGDLATCQPVSARDFYPAVILGDLHDLRAVPDLLGALKRPALPVYYLDEQPSPHTQYNAIFDSLRKLGSPDAAAPLRALWTSKTADVATRTLAVGAYGFVARDATDVDALGKIAANNTADDGLRQEAAATYARLARDPKHIAPLIMLAQKYVDAAATKRKAADAKKPAVAKHDAALESAKQALDTAKAKLLGVTNDSASTTAQIKAATDSTRKLEDAYRAAKKKHREQTTPYRQLDSAANAYTGYARMFQTHAARIEIAIRCKDDLACYGKSLTRTFAEVEAFVAPYIPGVAAWTPDEKAGLAEAQIERAMLELAKRGSAASEQTLVVLDHVAGQRRLSTQAILLALPLIAPRPCKACVTKLDAAIAMSEKTGALGDLAAVDAALLRSYFTWAK